MPSLVSSKKSRLNIVIVEGDTSLASKLVSLLHSSKMCVAYQGNIESARKFMEQSLCDAVVIDISTDSNALKFAYEVRQRYEKMLIVLTSVRGCHDLRRVGQLLHDPLVCFMPKPFLVEDICQQIKKMLKTC